MQRLIAGFPDFFALALSKAQLECDTCPLRVTKRLPKLAAAQYNRECVFASIAVFLTQLQRFLI